MKFHLSLVVGALFLSLMACKDNSQNPVTEEEGLFVSKPDFKDWAKTPPLGWNSYDAYS